MSVCQSLLTSARTPSDTRQDFIEFGIDSISLRSKSGIEKLSMRQDLDADSFIAYFELCLEIYVDRGREYFQEGGREAREIH